MYTTVLRLIWPYVMRYTAGQAAEYLQKRREEREEPLSLPQDRPVECPPCPPCPPAANINAIDQAEIQLNTISAYNKAWFGLSGLLLSAAFGAMLYTLIKD